MAVATLAELCVRELHPVVHSITTAISECASQTRVLDKRKDELLVELGVVSASLEDVHRCRVQLEDLLEPIITTIREGVQPQTTAEGILERLQTPQSAGQSTPAGDDMPSAASAATRASQQRPPPLLAVECEVEDSNEQGEQGDAALPTCSDDTRNQQNAACAPSALGRPSPSEPASELGSSEQRRAVASKELASQRARSERRKAERRDAILPTDHRERRELLSRQVTVTVTMTVTLT